jgi:AcrR family transcriptional regulator
LTGLVPRKSAYVPTRKNDPEGVRSRILDAAAELFQNQGYTATGMQAVFEKAEVTSGAFYHHFLGKKELGLAVVQERVAAEVENTWLAPLQAAATTLEGITKVLKGIASDLEKRRAVRGCPLNNLTLELAFADPDFKDKLQIIFERWTSELTAKLKQDVDAGKLSHVKPASFATYVIAVYSGAMALCKVYQSPKPLTQCLGELTAKFK